jgi:tRNA-2-methylthio-N6-dimethylallyladenosine synthase
VITTVVTGAAPHYLLADIPAFTVRRTRAGDAWEARGADCGTSSESASPASASPASASSVLLGMPSRRPTG